VLLRGVARQVTWAHGLVAEAATATDGLQTLHTETQDLEKQIKQVWKTFAAAPAAHRRSSALLARIGAISQALGEIDAEFDEWQVLYRQVLQLDRAVRGEPQLYETVPSQQGDVVMSEKDAPTTAMSALPATESTELESESTAALIEGFAAQAAALAKKEIELAKTELRDDLKAEVAAVGRLGVAGLAAFMTVNLLLVTGVLVLARAMPVWGAGLLASGSTLLFSVIVGMAGWKKLTRAPLERTRRTLREDAQWTKERLA
jgi:hypothetical protein